MGIETEHQRARREAIERKTARKLENERVRKDAEAKKEMARKQMRFFMPTEMLQEFLVGEGHLPDTTERIVTLTPAMGGYSVVALKF